MKIKNILKKLGGSQPETRNAKPETQSSQPQPSSPEQSPPPNNSPAETPTAVDLGENASELEECVNRKSSIVNAPEPSKHASTYNTRPSTLDWRNATTNRSPRGKVAHLPSAIREQVCEWISEGITLQQIAKNLTDLDHPGFNHQNISNWKENGYRAWVRHQEQLEFARLRAEDTIASGSDSKLSEALLIARELHAANDLEEAMYAYDRNADEDTKIKQCRIIHFKARTYTNLNAQLLRSRKISADEKRHREEIDALLNQKAAQPLDEEAQRQAFLDVVDKWLGIKPYRASNSPAAQVSSARQEAERPDQLGGPSVTQQGKKKVGVTKAPAKTNENNAAAVKGSASLCKVPAEAHPSHLSHSSYPSHSDSSCSDAQRETRNLPIFESSHLGSLPSSHPPILPSSNLPVTPTQELEPWERLLMEPLTTPFSLPEPPALPRPFPADAEPLKELPSPSLDTPYPPAPLLQPERTLALCNYNGIVTAWVPSSEDPRKAKPWIAPIKNHKTGATICWFDFHSRPPGMTDAGPVRGQPHFIPIFDASGRIINWAPEPQGRHKRPPTFTAIALESDNPRTHFAWLEPSERKSS